ncbi:MAG: TfoX/Sxy family protein [Candidatus Endonucleobacter bathymodioli]|uniref:TfoX/Sxy family protein n=1 Tax=Candidatus Endonucleibacter bathymodioli TaxID=539814 RepID=A0AA90SDN5_9GAMM|nr:TfoX/Sxy family protein [Candidatus Endonucleobacter bathymodioli]
MSNELLELTNLGKTSVQWLNAVGIRTFEQLRNTGPAAIYYKVRERGFKASKVFLYALEGALNNTHWNNFTRDEKASLLEKVSVIEKHNEI